MIKLRFENPSCKSYNEGKVVVCRYDCTVYNNENKKILKEFTVAGVAKCAPTDTPNEEFGRKLADSRAKLQGYKKASNILSKSNLDALAKEVETGITVVGFIGYMHYLKNKELDHIEDICKEL